MQEDFKNINIKGKSFSARDCVDGILINPKLPKNFDSTNNEYRPASHQKFGIYRTSKHLPLKLGKQIIIVQPMNMLKYGARGGLQKGVKIG